MNPRLRTAARAVVIAGGIAVTVAGVLAFRPADWPIYVTFLLVSVVLFVPYVEVMPHLPLSIPDMAATIGFLYIGGLPIIVLRNITPLLTRGLRRVLPQRWQDRLPQLRKDAPRGEPLPSEWFSRRPWNAIANVNSAAFAIGLGVRWWIATAIAPGQPAGDPGAVALGEAGGYACWGALSLIPIFPYRPPLPPSSEGGRAALIDIGLVIVLALTPFVFLITYGFSAHGLPAAAAWALSALGLHFMLKRMNDRRLTVEEQNRSLEALNKELEHRERLSAIGKMSSVVSHQILQQLGVIGLYADLIRNADKDGEPAARLARAAENAAAIEGAVHDVNRVLTDLLVFSKDLRLNLYEHSLGQLVAECLDDCRGEAAAARVTLRGECDAEIRLVLDKLKMKQALANVVRNAIDASPADGAVVVSLARRDDAVEIAVADQGPGIAKANLEAVFTPFFTTKEHGTGLGLAIAREFTEAHGGRLWAESGDGPSGARFIFQLPLR